MHVEHLIFLDSRVLFLLIPIVEFYSANVLARHLIPILVISRDLQLQDVSCLLEIDWQTFRIDHLGHHQMCSIVYRRLRRQCICNVYFLSVVMYYGCIIRISWRVSHHNDDDDGMRLRRLWQHVFSFDQRRRQGRRSQSGMMMGWK